MVHSILNQSRKPEDYNLFRPERNKDHSKALELVESSDLVQDVEKSLKLKIDLGISLKALNSQFDELKAKSNTSWFNKHPDAENIKKFTVEFETEITKWEKFISKPIANENHLEKLKILTLKISLINDSLENSRTMSSGINYPSSSNEHLNQASAVKLSNSELDIQGLMVRYRFLVDSVESNKESLHKQNILNIAKEILEIHRKLITNFSDKNGNFNEDDKKKLSDYQTYFNYFEESIKKDIQISSAGKANSVQFNASLYPTKKIYFPYQLANIRFNALRKEPIYTPNIIVQAKDSEGNLESDNILSNLKAILEQSSSNNKTKSDASVEEAKKETESKMIGEIAPEDLVPQLRSLSEEEFLPYASSSPTQNPVLEDERCVSPSLRSASSRSSTPELVDLNLAQASTPTPIPAPVPVLSLAPKLSWVSSAFSMVWPFRLQRSDASMPSGSPIDRRLNTPSQATSSALSSSPVEIGCTPTSALESSAGSSATPELKTSKNLDFNLVESHFRGDIPTSGSAPNSPIWANREESKLKRSGSWSGTEQEKRKEQNKEHQLG